MTMNKTQSTIIALLEGAGYNDAAEYVADEYVSSKLAGDKWQLIETAPRDGTKFNGYSPIGGVRRDVMWGQKRQDFDVNGWSGLERGYTHWMPQEPNPTPPSAPEVSDNEQPTDTKCAEALEWIKGEIHNAKLDSIEDRYGIKNDPDGLWLKHIEMLDGIIKALTRPQIDREDIKELVTMLEYYAETDLATLCNNSTDFVNRIKKLMEGE